jgi:hypothetical protein
VVNEYYLEKENKISIIDTQDEGTYYFQRMVVNLLNTDLTFKALCQYCSWIFESFSIYVGNSEYTRNIFLFDFLLIPLFAFTNRKILLNLAKKILIHNVMIFTKFFPFYLKNKKNKICLKYILSLLSKNEKIMLKGLSMLSTELSDKFVKSLTSSDNGMKIISGYEFVRRQFQI